MGTKIKKPGQPRPRIKGGTLTDIHTVPGLGSLTDLREELDTYWDVLLGHDEPPVEHGVHTMQEVATAYYARAKYIHGCIREAELEGEVTKGSTMYGFRTGMLRDFIEAASKVADLGSRRVTVAQLRHDMKLDAEDLDMDIDEE